MRDDEYERQKEEDLAGYWERYHDLMNTAGQTLSPDQVQHSKELGDALDKLREAERRLSFLRDTEDEEWAQLRQTFEKVETELLTALDAADARLTRIGERAAAGEDVHPHVG